MWAIMCLLLNMLMASNQRQDQDEAGARQAIICLRKMFPHRRQCASACAITTMLLNNTLNIVLSPHP